MKKLFTLVLIALGCFTSAEAKDKQQSGAQSFQKMAAAGDKQVLSEAAQKLYFIENKGQIVDRDKRLRTDVQFSLAIDGVNVFIGNGQLHHQFSKAGNGAQRSLYRMDVTLLGANTHAQVVTEEQQDYFEKYYQPHFGSAGVTAHAYKKITYKEIYPGIDWVLYIKNKQLEYDFVVKPGANTADIRIQYDGATTLGLDKENNLAVTTPMGTVREKTPYSYLAANGNKVASAFVLHDNIISFKVAPHQGTVVIDPTLKWGTYYGGEDHDYGNGVTCDAAGNVYIAGTTTSKTNIATTGSYMDTNSTNGTEAYIVKFDSTGHRKWATYYGGADNIIGGGGFTSGVCIHCDAVNNMLYISGYTSSSDGIATPGSHQQTFGGTDYSDDGFLVKFDTAGNLQWGTYYGGLGEDMAGQLWTDKWGNVIMTGSTALAGTYIAKFNSGGQLDWNINYEPGIINDITCDTAGYIYAVGTTTSKNGIATPNSFQDTLGSGLQSAFLVKFDTAGQVVWGTYYGGNGQDNGGGVSCDNAGQVYISGSTGSTDIANPGTFASAGRGFLAAFNSAGQFKWATHYAANSMSDNVGALSCDNLGNIYMTGLTTPTSAPSNPVTPDGYATIGNFIFGSSPYLAVFNSAGVRQWATYSAAGGTVCNDRSGNAYVVGSVTNADPQYGMVTPDAYQTNQYPGAGRDGEAILIKFGTCEGLPKPGYINGVADTLLYRYCITDSVQVFRVPAVSGATSYQWTLPSSWSGQSTADTIVVNGHGSLAGNGILYVSARNECGNSPLQKLAVSKEAEPQAEIDALGDTAICKGDSVNLLLNASDYFLSSVRWYRDGVKFLDSTLNYTTTVGGVYTVTLNDYTCFKTTDSVTIIVFPFTDPVINRNDSTLSVGSYETYQWYKNGSLVKNATKQTYQVTEDGIYYVVVTDSNGCGKQSASDTFNSLGVHTIAGNSDIRIYPNPAQSIIYIDAPLPVAAYLYSIEGKMLMQQMDAKIMDISALPDGMYMIRVTNKEGALLSTRKLVKSGK